MISIDTDTIFTPQAISAIVTALAFLVTFGKLIYDGIEKKKEIKNREQKTLYMLDLVFENETQIILKNISYIDEIRTNATFHKFFKDKYFVGFHENDNEEYSKLMIPVRSIETLNQDIYFIATAYKYIYENKMKDSIRTYKQNIKNTVKNHHLNLSSESLDKVNRKLEILNEVIENIDSISLDDAFHLNDINIQYPDDNNLDESIKVELDKVKQLSDNMKEIATPFNNKKSKSSKFPFRFFS